MDEYLKDPIAIEQKSFALIRAATDVSGFDQLQQQIVLRLVHTCGNPALAQDVRISTGAIESGVEALNQRAPMLCDVEMVKQGLTRRYLNDEPLCFLNHDEVKAMARDNEETRTMTALAWWRPHLAGSIAIIGNAPTALYRLMEMIEAGAGVPRLIIGMPVGFVGAGESKAYLWRNYRRLGVECVTIRGGTGGSALAAGAFNTLVRLKHNVMF